MLNSPITNVHGLVKHCIDLVVDLKWIVQSICSFVIS